MDGLAQEPRHRFTVDEVTQMVRSGILGEEDRVELIEGELLVMSPGEPPHANTVDRLAERLRGIYSADCRIRVQLQLDVSPVTQPEPDIAVVRGDERTYGARHPRGDDCVLVVEVAYSSRRRDLVKAQLYARAGVPVYWMVDLEKACLVVHERPRADGSYAHVRVLDGADEVELPGNAVRWRVADLLP
jgi:Uma2 family endonuclease